MHGENRPLRAPASSRLTVDNVSEYSVGENSEYAKGVVSTVGLIEDSLLCFR